jgi:membrane protein
MFGTAWTLVKNSVYAFIGDEALTRGAAIAFYTVTSTGPVLFIVGQSPDSFSATMLDGARSPVNFGNLMGRQSADLLQIAIENAAQKSAGILATAVGVITLVITASGVFTEMQQTLNVIWRAKLRGTTMSRVIRARAVSLGLVAALGFLLLVSLVVSTLLSALRTRAGISESSCARTTIPVVIPAKAGTQLSTWVPAFAGMTTAG